MWGSNWASDELKQSGLRDLGVSAFCGSQRFRDFPGAVRMGCGTGQAVLHHLKVGCVWTADGARDVDEHRSLAFASDASSYWSATRTPADEEASGREASTSASGAANNQSTTEGRGHRLLVGSRNSDG